MSIKKEYEKIEANIADTVRYLEKIKEINGLYKGIITLQSPIVKNPEILFVGINSGDGAFNENGEAVLQMIGNDEKNMTNLNWFQEGNARGGTINNKWNPYQWYERSKMVNNEFPKRMIDLLYEIDSILNPDISIEANKEPYWYNTLGKSIMYTNLYPIATTNISDLDRLLLHMTDQNEFKQFKAKSVAKSIWNIKLNFIKLTEELINLVKPKVIVCMGKSAYDDLLYTGGGTTGKIFKGTKQKIPVIGFSRQGNWSNLIPKIAENIADKLK